MLTNKWNSITWSIVFEKIIQSTGTFVVVKWWNLRYEIIIFQKSCFVIVDLELVQKMTYRGGLAYIREYIRAISPNFNNYPPPPLVINPPPCWKFEILARRRRKIWAFCAHTGLDLCRKSDFSRKTKLKKPKKVPPAAGYTLVATTIALPVMENGCPHTVFRSFCE